MLLSVFVLSGCVQRKDAFENSGQEVSQQEISQPMVESEGEPLPEEEQGGFILEDDEAVYACGYSRILKIDKQGNQSSVIWSSRENRAEGAHHFSAGRALLLQNKIYFIEVSDQSSGLGEVCILSVVNRDGTGYRQVDQMDGYSRNLFFVDGILYVTFQDFQGERVSAYEIHEDGSILKIQDVYTETPYQYVPEGYKEIDYLSVPESYKRLGRLLLRNKERQIVAVDPETGVESQIDIGSFVNAASGNLLLYMVYEQGPVHLYLLDGISLKSELLGDYEEFLNILGMDSDYIYAEMKNGVDDAEEEHTYYRIALKTGELEELFTRNEMDDWSQACFYPYVINTTLRDGYIYYGDWRDYKMYLIRRNTEAPNQEEVLGEAYYDSGIGRIGKVEPYREKIYSQQEPSVLLYEIDMDRLVVDEQFSGAKEINRFFENVQEEQINSIRRASEELEEMYGRESESHRAYSFSNRVSEIYYFDGTYVSFYQSEYGYWGGAHGMPSWYGCTFNLKTGKKLALEDIIDNNEEELRNIITRYFAGMIDKDPEAFWKDAVSDVEESAGYDTDFYLTQDGITFYYPPYALTCFAGGFQEMTIPYSEFRMKIPVGKEQMQAAF